MFMQHFWSEEWRRKTHQSFGLIDEIVEFCRPVRTALLFFPNSFGEKTDDRITLLARKGAHVFQGRPEEESLFFQDLRHIFLEYFQISFKYIFFMFLRLK